MSRDQVKRLLDSLKETAPALVEEVVPGLLSAGQVHRVLQNLLSERRSIRDLETILEALADHATTNRDIDSLTDQVRKRLTRMGPAHEADAQLAAAAA